MIRNRLFLFLLNANILFIYDFYIKNICERFSTTQNIISSHIKGVSYIKYDVKYKRKRDIRGMKEKYTFNRIVKNGLIYGSCLIFIKTQLNCRWFYNFCKIIFRFFRFKHVITETDMIFYFACEFTLFILLLRVCSLRKEEDYAVKNGLILYMNFIATEKFHSDISKLFNLFCIAYRSTFFAVLFLRNVSLLYRIFDALFETSIVTIYLLMFVFDYK